MEDCILSFIITFSILMLLIQYIGIILLLLFVPEEDHKELFEAFKIETKLKFCIGSLPFGIYIIWSGKIVNNFIRNLKMLK